MKTLASNATMSVAATAPPQRAMEGIGGSVNRDGFIGDGETPDAVRDNPALKGLNIPRTGRTGSVGTLVTKTLVIAGESGFFTTSSGQRGAMLRAYDKATGKEVGAVYMPAPQSGSPMTYILNGQQ